MSKRRPLTEQENAAANRLQNLYQKAKAEWRECGQKLTQEKIAELFGWSGQTAVSQYLNGNIPLNLRAAGKFADFFSVQISEISPELAETLPEDAGGVGTRRLPLNSVPMLSWAQVGKRHEPPGLNPDEVTEWTVCPVKHSRNTFALTVDGPSMQSSGDSLSFYEGDIIHVDADLEAEHNALVVVRLPERDTVTFRQLVIEQGKRYLKALNPAWPSRIIEMPKGAVMCGVVISKVVSFR